jgi:hypothetical protein
MIITPGGSIPVYVSVPTVPPNQIPAQVRLLDAYYTQYPGSPCGAGVCINFYPLSGASISRYGIYRSVVGFQGDVVHPTVVDGKTLQLSINLGAAQTITFDGATPIIDRMNSYFSGGRAIVSMGSPTRFIWRVEGGSSPGVVQILGGTALADLGLTAGTYSNQSKSYLVAYVDAKPEDDADGVEFCDPDGTIYDSYRVTTVDLSNEESKPTNYVTPTGTTGKVCWIYGVVSDPAGVRIPDAEVRARVLEIPQSVVPPAHINSAIVSTLSNPQGRYEICLIQGSLVEISIPSIYYTRQVRIPAQSRAAITDLLVDRDNQYPLGVEV